MSRLLTVAFAGLVLVGLTVRADEPAASADQVAQLIKQLDADKYAERQAASEQLAKLGMPAVEPLKKAATAGTLEVTVRSIEVLGKLAGSSDGKVKEAAQAALEEISKSGHDSAARRATAALVASGKKPAGTPAKPASTEIGGQPMPGMPVPIGPIPIGGGIIQGRAQIIINAGGAGAKKISTKIENGVKTIEAEEDGRKVKIVEDDKGIKMEITETKDGKEKTDKYEAKDAEELKKKDAKAHEIYEKYSQQDADGGIRIQFGGQGGQGAPILPLPRQGRLRVKAVPAEKDEKPADKPTDKPADPPAEKKTDEKPVEKKTEAEKKADEKPASEKPAATN